MIACWGWCSPKNFTRYIPTSPKASSRKGVFWRDMGVINLPGGKPTMKLTNGALRRLEQITPKGHIAVIDLTITDDFPLAQAIVIISAVAQPPQEAGK